MEVKSFKTKEEVYKFIDNNNIIRYNINEISFCCFGDVEINYELIWI